MELTDSLYIAAAGMRTQGFRLRIVAENMANANSTASEPGGDPYRRKMVTFKNALDRSLGLMTVQVDKVVEDDAEFEKRLQPDHPAADADGYVKLPNVNSLVEMTDMREAQRSYEANMKVIEAARGMLQRTVDLLR
jgi:flagellar basal-body rod protein FlgC